MVTRDVTTHNTQHLFTFVCIFLFLCDSRKPKTHFTFDAHHTHTHSTAAAMPTAATQLQYNAALTATDPQAHPVLIIGQLRHLTTLKFDHVRQKLEPRVAADTFERAVASLHPSPTDHCPLYLNVATVIALPVQSSRHNTNSRAHALTRVIRTHACTVTESIVVSDMRVFCGLIYFCLVNINIYIYIC